MDSSAFEILQRLWKWLVNNDMKVNPMEYGRLIL